MAEGAYLGIHPLQSSYKVHTNYSTSHHTIQEHIGAEGGYLGIHPLQPSTHLHSLRAGLFRDKWRGIVADAF